MPDMKILLTMNVPYFPAHGGANNSNRLLLESLAGRGHTVRVVVPVLGVPPLFTHDELIAQLVQDGVALKQDASAFVFSINAIETHAVKEASQLRAYLKQQLESFRPDFVIVSTEDPSQTLLDVAVKSAVPVVYMARTTSFLPFGPQAYFPSEARAKLLERVAAIVTVSDFVAGYVAHWSGLRAHSLPISFFGKGPFPDFANFDAGYVTLINPCAVKGIAIFLGLAKAFPRVPFAAVPTWGTTPEDRAALEALANVTVLPPVTDVDQLYGTTRIVLVPSLWAEAKPRTVVEAMLRGIPVLAADTGGIAEVADQVLPVQAIERFTDKLDHNFLPIPVVPEQDLNPWIAALDRLLTDRAHYEARSRAVRKRSQAYVSALDCSPFEQFLLRLQKDPESAAPGRMRMAEKTEPVETGGPRIEGLSAAQQALLIHRLKQKKRTEES
jgi:glycosyltransferase involved in cell wall biosynthesis